MVVMMLVVGGMDLLTLIALSLIIPFIHKDILNNSNTDLFYIRLFYNLSPASIKITRNHFCLRKESKKIGFLEERF